MKYIVSFIILFLSINAAYPTAGYPCPVILDGKPISKNIFKCVEYLEDRNNSLTFKKIRSKATARDKKWEKSGKESLGFGYTDSTIWVRFVIKNIQDKDTDIYLVQEYPLIDYIDLYQPYKKGAYKRIETGRNFNFSKRPVDYKTFVFPLKIRASSQNTYYMKFKSKTSMHIGLVLYSENEFQNRKNIEMPLLWMLYGILLVMALYNLSIFSVTRDISYLYYVSYNFIILLLLMSVDGTAYQYLWGDSPWWSLHCIPLFLGLGIALVTQFTRHFVRTYKYYTLVDRLLFVPIFLGIVFAATALIPGLYNFSIMLTTGLALVGIAYITPILFDLCFIKKSREGIYFSLSFLLFYVGMVLYIFKTFSILEENLFTNYCVHLGVTAKSILLSLGLADRINTLREEKRETEIKYVSLIEGSRDIMFSLDEDLKFTTVNKAVTALLGYRRREINGESFLDLIHELSDQEKTMSRKIVEEYISDLKRDKKNITFRADFKTHHGHEPKELSVRLEYLEYKGKAEILGKASSVTDDIILQYLDTESHKYTIDNYLSKADLMSYRLTRNLEKYMDQSDISIVRICLREILINAIEHGNLDISFDEKTKALDNNEYIQFLNKRQNDPEHRSKKVLIDYILNDESVTYIITDQGRGFNHYDILQKDPGQTLAHGRGLMMTKNAFDVVDFNDKGNRVTLIKYLKT